MFPSQYPASGDREMTLKSLQPLGQFGGAQSPDVLNLIHAVSNTVPLPVVLVPHAPDWQIEFQI